MSLTSLSPWGMARIRVDFGTVDPSESIRIEKEES
jgi:hypothetical protein